MPDPRFDDWMDAQLRNVPVPRDLLKRLAEGAAAQTQADERLDAMLRDVPVPPNLELHLRRIGRQRRMPATWIQVAMAASVLFAVSAAAMGYLGSIINPSAPRGAAVANSTPPASQPHSIAPLERPLNLPPGVRTIANRQRPERPLVDDEPAAATEAPALPFTFDDMAALGKSMREAVEARRRTQATLGAGGELARLPRLDVLQISERRGLTPPRVRGYDLLFQLKHGEHPVVSPAAHGELTSSRLPLSFQTASYDLAARALRDGQLPAADEIRVEDFLAAQDYPLPPAAPNQLALQAAICRSPLADAAVHELQVVVKAGARRAGQHPATRLFVVVDSSWTMADAGRWDTTLRALERLARVMRATDRLTLIGFGEQAKVLAENASSQDLASWIESATIDCLSGNSRPEVGVQAALDASEAAGDNLPRRVVLLTPAVHLQGTSVDEVRQRLTQLTSAKVGWQWIEVGAARSTPVLGEIVHQAGGKHLAADSPAAIEWQLAELLTGQPQLVAAGTAVKLTFNPKAVSGYRLLGHEAGTLTGQSIEALEVDLHAGDLATGMYELWLQPNEEPLIATVELTWRDAASGQPRKAVQRIQRGQIAPTFFTAPHWLQQGVLAAKTAEVLRGSYYAPTSRPFHQLHEMAAQVDAKVAAEASFRELIDLIDRAQKLR